MSVHTDAEHDGATLFVLGDLQGFLLEIGFTVYQQKSSLWFLYSGLKHHFFHRFKGLFLDPEPKS